MRHFGEQTPRYLCALNRFRDAAFTRCPKCDAPTKDRRFAIVTHVKPRALFCVKSVQKLCVGCELLVVKVSRFEEELSRLVGEVRPELLGNGYFTIGTTELSDWKGFPQGSLVADEIVPITADFRNVFTLKAQPLNPPPP